MSQLSVIIQHFSCMHGCQREPSEFSDWKHHSFKSNSMKSSLTVWQCDALAKETNIHNHLFLKHHFWLVPKCESPQRLELVIYSIINLSDQVTSYKTWLILQCVCEWQSPPEINHQGESWSEYAATFYGTKNNKSSKSCVKSFMLFLEAGCLHWKKDIKYTIAYY